MSLSLQDFANGDTNYVAKLNANNGNLRSAVDALDALLASQIQSAQGPGGTYLGLFGAGATLIGDGAYEPSGSGSTLTVAAGAAWLASLSTVVYKNTTTALSFSGQSAATYYVIVDSTGTPSRSASSTEALYSVVWDGSAFGTITRVAKVFWNAVDMNAALTSTALGATYETLDDRLEAAESLASGAGTGDVVGPASAVANNVALFDGTTGKLIKDSGLALSGTNTGDQLVFKTISVSGQSDVVADSTTDTLTLAAGSGITITTNAGTDTVTIASSGGTDRKSVV